MWKLSEISPFKTNTSSQRGNDVNQSFKMNTSSQGGNCWKWRPLHPVKMQIVQNQSRSPHPPKVKIIKNQSNKEYHTLSKGNCKKSVLKRSPNPLKVEIVEI